MEQQIDEILASLGKEELNEKLLASVMSLLAGEKIETEEVSVKLEIPTAIYEMVLAVTNVSDISTEAVFGQMASQGFYSEMKKNFVSSEEDTRPNSKQNISSIGKIGDLLEKLTEITQKAEAMESQLQSLP